MERRYLLFTIFIVQILFYNFSDKIILDAESLYNRLNKNRIDNNISPLTIDKSLEKKANAATQKFINKGEMPESNKYEVYSFTVAGRKSEYPVYMLDENTYLSQKLKSEDYKRIGISVVYNMETDITFGVIFLD